MNKIALAMISKGTGQEVTNLRRCLKSIAPYVDGIFITLTGPKTELADAEKVCQEFNVNISYGDFKHKVDKKTFKWVKDFLGYEPHMKVGNKIFRFDEARNYNFSQVPKDYDWILWLDTDDVFLGGEKLKDVLELGEKNKIEAFYFDYLYQVDVIQDEKLPPEQWKIRNIIIQHLRERLVRNEGKYKWIAPIHETLIEQTPTNKSDNYDCAVMHLATEEDRVNSLTRNLPNLELAIYESKGKDPRHLYYLAKAYFDIQSVETDKKAIPLILAYLYGEHKSGWPAERAQACEYLAELYRRNGQMNNSIKSVMNGFIEDPNNPALFLELAQSYVEQKDYERALFWVKIADSIPLPKTTLVRNPRDIEGQKLEIVFNCAQNMGNIDAAWAAAVKMIDLMPDNPQVKMIYDNISLLREQRDISKVVVTLADYLKKTGEHHKLKPLLASVPQISDQVPAIVDLKNKNLPPKPWAEDEIAIYCGPGFTHWDGRSLEKPGDTFVGGSEEAVIRMSEELTKLGWKVTVYCDPIEDIEHNGVKYISYYRCNYLDNFNILISWRNIGITNLDLKYKKLYIWNHDIQDPLSYGENAIKKVDKFIFLSKWHRNNVPALPEEKTWITSNGI